MSNLPASELSQLKATPLYALHREWNARMVSFAGYQMPVQYATGIIKEHRHTRAHAGLFDISHMGQFRVSGESFAESLERLVPSDISGVALNQQRYTVFTNDQGGIIDDCMVTNYGDHGLIVANAVRKQRVFDHLRSNLDECHVAELSKQALLALQGPESSIVMERLASGASQLSFMSSYTFSIGGVECLVNRCGYTGEDGYEISVLSDQVEILARLLTAQDEVAPIGLGARDSLRLEAGLCLYGQDIDETTSPIEAGLDWVIAKKYLQGASKPALFPGADQILHEIQEGPCRERVGIKPDGRVPVRQGADLYNIKGNVVGRVTSGGFGPTVEGPVAMGYVGTDYAPVGTKLNAMIRNRLFPVSVVSLPFVPHRYYKHG